MDAKVPIPLESALLTDATSRRGRQRPRPFRRRRERKFRSKALDANDKYSVAFDRLGEFTYFCGLRQHMTGKIIVAP